MEPIEGKFRWVTDKDGNRVKAPVYHILCTHVNPTKLYRDKKDNRPARTAA